MDQKPETPKLRNCGQMVVYSRFLEADPGNSLRMAQMESQTRQRLLPEAALKTMPTVTIPVVVHVVYNLQDENISDGQIISQIDVLNRDYAAANPDRANIPTAAWAALVIDSRIRFALARRDPSGNPTNGITRTQTDRTSFGTNDRVKSSATGGADPWPSDTYLNVWVCTLNGLLGYASFPGMLPTTNDGVVCLNTAFGTNGSAAAPFDRGRTMVHEVGHWLNLRHIWGDTTDCSGDDYVADTPKAQLPNYNNPTFPHVSCNNAPDGDMFMNYMDYVNDEAMVMFTAGQVARMRATLAGPRASIVDNAVGVL